MSFNWEASGLFACVVSTETAVIPQAHMGIIVVLCENQRLALLIVGPSGNRDGVLWFS